MNPNQQLDQDAVRLAKAIRHTESRDDFNAKGASGEFGAYQWMPDTWASTTKKYNLDSSDVSRENQNKAAYMTIKELKDAGKRPDQIAAYWNSGKTEGWENNKGINKYGVKYDTPDYVRKVGGVYQGLKSSEIPKTATTSSTVGAEEYGTPDGEKRNVAENLIEFDKGILKGAGRSAINTGLIGKFLLEQGPGRAINALTTGSFSKLPAEDTAGLESNKKVTDILEAKNLPQKLGGYAEAVGEIALPGGIGARAFMKSRAAGRAFGDALEVVAPKETAKTIKAGLKQGRGKVEGFFREVGMTPDEATERAARAVEGLVKRGATAAENANAVRGGIENTAKELVTSLKNQDINAILTPGELRGLMTRASNAIGEDPTMVGNAGESAARIFKKFTSYLPKGRDIDAADLLDARKKLDGWMRGIKGDKAFDPATENALTIALRSIRQEANDLIARKAPDVAVKELLAKQSAMYDALENIAAKGVKELGTSGPVRLLDKHPLIKKGLIGLLPTGIVGGYIGGKVSGD